MENQKPKKARNYQREAELRKQRNQARKEAEKQGDKANVATNPKKPQKHQESSQINDCEQPQIPLSLIVPDPNQPRKYFDPVKMNELVQSVIQNGVLQPIRVRPIDGGLYMIVYGERRFRAALAVFEKDKRIDSIPAIITDLSDSQAREMQLRENIDRDDMHPLEEGEAFAELQKSSSVEDIANTFHRSEVFVASRISLTHLVNEWKEIFTSNKMTITQALKLSKLAPAAQQAIYDNVVNPEWRNDKDYRVRDITGLISQGEKVLDSATFKTEDVDLYPEAGACNKCKFNSANNLQLFIEPEMTVRICSNSTCFAIKTDRAYNQKIEEMIDDPKVVFIANTTYTTDDKAKIKAVADKGVNVLPAGSWQVMVDGMATDGKEVHKGFVVAGNGEGKVVNFIATTPEAEKQVLSTIGESNPTIDFELQISELEKKEARSKELDGEKVWSATREIFLADGGTNFMKDGMLTKVEENALALSMFESLNYESQSNFIKDALCLKTDDSMEIGEAIEHLDESHFETLCRYLIKEKLFPAMGSHLKNRTCYLGKKVAEEYYPEQIKNAEAEIAAKAGKRGLKIGNQIDELKQQIKGV